MTTPLNSPCDVQLTKDVLSQAVTTTLQKYLDQSSEPQTQSIQPESSVTNENPLYVGELLVWPQHADRRRVFHA